MPNRKAKLPRLVAAGLAATLWGTPVSAFAGQAPAPAQPPDAAFVPTPQPVVEGMLALARVGPNDVVCDLRSGDGRTVIAAIRHGARRAVGVDIDPARVAEARANARAAGVEDRVRFIQANPLETDLSPATVIVLHPADDANMHLRPKLLRLKPGTHVVSPALDLGDWKPEREQVVDGQTIYLWTVTALRPPRQARTWGH